MKQTLSVLKSRWFITLIGVIALSLLIWFVGPLIAIADYKPLAADWVRMLCIMLLLLIWGGSNMYRMAKSKKNETRLAEGVTQTEEQATHDVSAVKSQFTEAVRMLKRASGGKSARRNYLYELPWYLMIGPPGSGKTTALVNSGLEFPLENHYGKNSVKGVGGTRNCDWWFTNEAVLIDTAGRYTTQDSHTQGDRAEWKKFIDLLKKYRKRQPINGVLVAISIEDILSQSDADKDRQIKAVRARLQELIEDLGVKVPVYLLFTKCDLITGFMETFDSLNKDLRSQVWGMTLPTAELGEALNYQQWFTAEFDDLVDRLQSQQFSKFYFERDIQRRAKILNFPHELKTIQQALSEFVGRAFSDSRFHDQFLLRGVYLTSGTQDSSSLHRAIHQMANPLGIQAKQVLNQPQQGRSYFLRNLLHQVVFPEASLVGANTRYERYNRWLRSGALVGCISLLVLAGFGFSHGFAQNQLNLNKLQGLLENYEQRLDSVPSTYTPHDLLGVIAVQRMMGQVFHEDTAGWANMGLYQGNKINEAIEGYADKFTAGVFLNAIKNALEHTLHSQLDQPDKLRHTLKAYLMLHDEAHFDAEFVQQWFDHYWKNKYFDQPQQLAVLSSKLTALLADFRFVELDQSLIAQCRTVIRSVPLDKQILNAIRMEAEQRYAVGFRFADQLGSDFYRVFDQGDHRIPRLFTFDGYNSVFKPGLETAIDELAEDNWVVGTTAGDLTDMDLAEVQAKVEKQYYEDYISQWEEQLFSLSLKNADSMHDLALFIDTLRSGRSPLRGVLEELSLNTQLTVSLVTEEDIKENVQDAQSVARAVDPRATKLARIARLASRNRFANLPENPTLLVDKRFTDIHKFVEPQGNRPAKFDLLLDDLAELQLYLERILNAGSESEAAYQAALNRFSGPRQDIFSTMRLSARHYPEPLGRWVSAITNQAWRQVLSHARSYVSLEYKNTLWPIYKRTIANRYPFDRRANREVALHDFAEFFKKDGVMDLFFKDYLEPFVNTAARPWRLKAVDGYNLGINRHYLKQFEQAEKIRTLFFKGQAQPVVDFSVRPIYLDANVSRFELSLMGERQVYRHGPAQLLDVSWPSRALESSVGYQFQDYYNAKAGDQTDGPWSLFRFFDKYPLESTKHGNRYHLTMENNGRKAVYEIIAASSQSPLGANQVLQFKLPTAL